jgi:hypothetical protein
MEPNPYKFSATNPRLVEAAERSPNVLFGTAAIFLVSIHLYNRKWFRKDKNVMNALLFTALSCPASFSYASFMFSSAEKEAAIQNN